MIYPERNNGTRTGLVRHNYVQSRLKVFISAKNKHPYVSFDNSMEGMKPGIAFGRCSMHSNLQGAKLTGSYYFLLFSTILMLLNSCANIVAPTGGDRDATAPVIKEKNYTDSMLQVKGRKFEMEFDEFVQIKDVANQLVITPLTAVKPKLTAHKKKVVLEIPDSLLLENTTYTIQFGKSIADIHEGNVAQIPEITFSTGSYFDSLRLSGSVWDAETGATDTGSIVLLYDAAKPDSVVRTEIPLYIQKTSGGTFSFQHLPGKRFKIFALGDKNNNLKYDGGIESIAFLNRDIDSRDTSEEIKLYSFQEKVVKKDSVPTRGIPEKNKATKAIPFSYEVNADTTNASRRSFELTDTLKITFPFNFSNWDKGKLILKQNDVIDATSMVESDSSRKVIRVKTDWMEDAIYTLQLTEGFAIDSTGSRARDGLFRFHTKRKSDYGMLIVKPGVQVNDWLWLFSDQKVLRKANAADTSVAFNLLAPGSYQLRILHDKNGNGSYDPGSLREKRQPELVERIPREIVIKANWENKLDLRSASSDNLKRKR